MKPHPSSASDTDERHDLPLVLYAGAVSALALGGVALAAQGLAHLPLSAEWALVVAALVGLTSAGGWVALRAGRPVRAIGWVVLVLFTLLETAAVHLTGGPQTPMPGFYLLVIVAAAFVLGPLGVGVVTGLSLAAYTGLLLLYATNQLAVVPIWDAPFNPHGNTTLLIVNWLAVALPILLTAFMSGTLAQRLRARHEQLLASELARSVMIELLVHDLRNPLTILLNVLELIGLVEGPVLSPQQQDLIGNARRSGNFLVGLISDLLDVSRLEAGQLPLKREPLELPRLLAEAAERVRLPASQGELTLEVAPAEGPLPAVVGDGLLIQRVLANLLANAVAHTPPGGRVQLAARSAPAGFVTVSVSDTGQGIPPDQQQRIFEKFAQVERRGSPRRGSGLGLTFCKLAVEAHGGRIWVESAPEQGSIFAFTLPVGAAEPGGHTAG